MAFFGIDDTELKQREQALVQERKKIEDINRQKCAEIDNIVSSARASLVSKFDELDKYSSSIYDKSRLQEIYNSHIATLREQEKLLKETLENFQKDAMELQNNARAIYEQEHDLVKEALEDFRKDATELHNKTRDLCQKERSLLEKEIAAKCNFAGDFGKQLAPLKALQSQIEQKEAKLIELQEKYCESYKARELELLERYNGFKSDLEKQYNEKFSELQKKSNALAEKENALNQLSNDLLAREDAVRNGLSEERAAMLQEIHNIRQRVKEEEAGLRLREQELVERESALREQEGRVTERENQIQLKEIEAEQGFTEKKLALQAEIDALKNSCIQRITDEEQKSFEKRAQLLQDTIVSMEKERNNKISALNDELKSLRKEDYKNIADEKAILTNQKSVQEQKEAKLNARESDLNSKENKLRIKEEELQNQIQFVAQKERIVSEKYRKIAEEQIQAKNEEVVAIKAANDKLHDDIVNLRLKYEEQKAINNRFQNKLPEEIYAKIETLEQENTLLKMKFLSNANIK